ncbi:MAG TPA: cell division protein ZipA C-terminal FtsZ-binding domain-containing protein [Steroidobacteraceae bacterium]|jgi:cell division protein ZipA|nr:cell division protein ZipA C-terminal FtsZ-binding domain-containing protein [Steroidobacteraceae bacterium]
MSELRLALLIPGVAFIAALIWWEWRRPRQANADGGVERLSPRDPDAQGAGARAPREPPLALPEMRAREPLAAREPPLVDAAREPPGVPVLSPFAPLVVARSGVDEESGPAAAADPPAEAVQELPAMGADTAPPVSAAVAPAREELPRLPAGPSPVVEWPPDAQRQIVSLRLVAATPERFVGRSLRQALAAEGFVLGRFAIFHKPDDEQRAVLSAASLTRPGTFDADTMDSQHFGGLSLFAVLPGPRPAPQAFEELISTARNLSERLHGVLQDERGSPLTATRIAVLRERVSSESPW